MRSSTSRPAWHERRRLLALWVGVLAGPVVWLLLLEFNYALSYVACETRQTWFLHAAAAVAAGLVGAAGAWGWSARLDDPLTPEHAAPPLSGETARQRVRWLAMGSLILSAAFILLIAATQIPVVVLHVCD